MLTANGKVWENPAVGVPDPDDGMPLRISTYRSRLARQADRLCSMPRSPFETRGLRSSFTNWRPSPPDANAIGQDRSRIQEPGRLGSGELIKMERAKDPNGKLKGSFPTGRRLQHYAVKSINKDLKLPHDYQYSTESPTKSSSRRSCGTVFRRRPPRPIAGSNSRLGLPVARIVNSPATSPIESGTDDGPGNCRADRRLPRQQPGLEPRLARALDRRSPSTEFRHSRVDAIIAYSQSFQRAAVVHELSSSEPFRFSGPGPSSNDGRANLGLALDVGCHNHWAYQRPTAEDLAKVIDIDWQKANLEMPRRRRPNSTRPTLPVFISARSKKLCGFEGQLLVRASEIPTPVPLRSLLRQFRQSDREAIEAGRTVATVPQILAMFNGPITHLMLKKDSVLSTNLVKAVRPMPSTSCSFRFSRIDRH